MNYENIILFFLSLILLFIVLMLSLNYLFSFPTRRSSDLYKKTVKCNLISGEADLLLHLKVIRISVRTGIDRCTDEPFWRDWKCTRVIYSHMSRSYTAF